MVGLVMIRRLALFALLAGFVLTVGAQGVVPASAVGPCGDPVVRPWCATNLTPDQRATMLVQAMTPDERIALLGGDIVTGGPVNSPHTGASFANTRLGIPAVYFSDGPVGPRQGPATALPVPMALAATFSTDAARQHGYVVANEVKLKGNSVVFAPTVNIMRNPQNGRTYEAYGEDPYQVTRTTVNWIESAQAEGVIANVKHFAGNNQEGLVGAPPIVSAVGGRSFTNDVIDERTLREVYLPQFEAAVKEAQVGTIMCSYNQVNGQYACENQHLLTDILKKEWGFQGFALADYVANHNTAPAIANGLDFEPWPAQAYSPNAIRAAVTSGLVTQAQVDEHTFRMLRVMFRFGIFDRPAYPNNDNLIDKAANGAISQSIEESAITLLKNQGAALPINPTTVKKVAVIGPYGDRFVTGGGSGQVTPFSSVTALAGIRARLGSAVTVTFDDGSNVTQAVADAAAADQAIVVVGDVNSEGQDKGTVNTTGPGLACIELNCPDDAVNALAFACNAACPPNGSNENGLITSVAAAQPRTTVVLQTSGPVLTPWRDQVPAILEAWYPGARGGNAIARVLFGDVNPSGRLPVTFPQNAGDTPTANDLARYPGVGVTPTNGAYPGPAQTVTYSEGVFIGYRWYDAKNITPAFEYGSGLSYTTFGYANLEVAAGGAGGAVATISMDVTNTGTRAGAVVPQLYMHLPSPSASVLQPPKQLRGYRKVNLAPGQTTRVSFPLDERAFSYWDVAGSNWKVAPGCYELMGGDSSRRLPLSGTIGRNSTACGTGAVNIAIPTGDSGSHLPNTGGIPPILVALAGLVTLLALAVLGFTVRNGMKTWARGPIDRA